MGGDSHFRAAFNDVVIGDHITVRSDEKSGTAGKSADGSSVVVHILNLNGDGHYRVHILLVNLAGSQILTGCQRSSGSIGSSLPACFLLNGRDLIIHLLGQILHFIAPMQIHKECCRAAAAQHQGQRQQDADAPAHTLTLLFGLGHLRLRGYVVGFRLLGLGFIVIIIKIAHKAISLFCFL